MDIEEESNENQNNIINSNNSNDGFDVSNDFIYLDIELVNENNIKNNTCENNKNIFVDSLIQLVDNLGLENKYSVNEEDIQNSSKIKDELHEKKILILML